MDALSYFAEGARADSFADKVIANKPVVGNFLASLKSLPVTLFFLLRLLELRQGLSQGGLHALSFSHFINF